MVYNPRKNVSIAGDMSFLILNISTAIVCMLLSILIYHFPMVVQMRKFYRCISLKNIFRIDI